MNCGGECPALLWWEQVGEELRAKIYIVLMYYFVLRD